mmetsp:Transcript_37836/g.89542  ORF Transcript_37836/g.89542 Transcript_37836/m.89542 type:complete len:1016 (+) Transcript_37836:94-3141(+)
MQAMWQQPQYGNIMVGKKGMKEGPQKQKLPYPLSEENVGKCLSELNSGTRRAVETCIECFQNNRMSKEDLLCFMQSICSQGKTLKHLFAKSPSSGMGERASDADIAAIRALGENSNKQQLAATSAQFGDVATEEEMAELRALAAFTEPPAQKKPEAVCAVVHGSDVPMSAGATRPNAAPIPALPKPKPARVRRAKITEPSDEEKALMAWWSERRIPEVLRRQTESCDTSVCTTDLSKRVAYMKFVMTELKDALPVAGKKQLLSLVSTLISSGNEQEFTTAVKDLVDEHGVSISLSFQAEVNVRQQVKRRMKTGKQSKASLMEEDEVEDDWDMAEEEEDAPAPTPIKTEKKEESESKEPAKRKRTETLKGSEPKVGDDEEEDARCPVCIGHAQDDDRWVKCDGCASWYHQICVLFNEQAHGKSVRFFCRTPGCRKRGSRQLNRRQRKPCYPSSPGLEASALGDRLSRFAQQLARQDRQIVVKMVANQASVRESESARGVEESVQSKTLLCFQHTMIGSDLLFLVLFVEEIRCSDGSARVEISHLDSNGLYEGLEEGERQRVEGAVVVGYLEHAADSGFATARIQLKDTSATENSLFFARPQQHAWSGIEEARAFIQTTLAEAQTGGLVHSFGEPADDMIAVRLNTDKAGPDAQDVDVEMRSVVAGRPSEWAELMSGNTYRFDSLQFAKFSSMMLVYHVIKGSKREATQRALQPASERSLGPTPMPVQELSEDEDMEFAMSAPAPKRPRGSVAAAMRMPPIKHEEASASAPIQQHIPQPPPKPAQPTPAIFESPMIRSSGFMPSPMVRYSVFNNAPSESPMTRSSAFPGPLESPAIRSSLYRGPGESPAIGSSLWRDSPAMSSSIWRGPAESPACNPSVFRGPGDSPYTGASPYAGACLWRGADSPATRPVAFPGESPSVRPSSFPMQSPSVRAVMASPGTILASPAGRHIRSPPRVPSLGASHEKEHAGMMEPMFSFSDSMLEDVVDQSLGSAFAADTHNASKDPFWDNFLTQLQN